jgi:hypothetical protein
MSTVEPTYTVIKNLVGAYVQNDKDLANLAPMGGAWRKITRQTADK